MENEGINQATDNRQTDIEVNSSENEVNNEDTFEREAQETIRESNIQGTQIDFPSDSDDIDNDIILPPQMRCFAHLLNLIGNCSKVIDTS